MEDCIVNPQQRSNFLPLLHGQGAFRPIFDISFQSQSDSLISNMLLHLCSNV